jgi:hypothetical protein
MRRRQSAVAWRLPSGVSMNNRNHGPEPGDRSGDALGGPDESAHEDELGPEQAENEDTFGGPDESAHEDELSPEHRQDT